MVCGNHKKLDAIVVAVQLLGLMYWKMLIIK